MSDLTSGTRENKSSGLTEIACDAVATKYSATDFGGQVVGLGDRHEPPKLEGEGSFWRLLRAPWFHEPRIFWVVWIGCGGWAKIEAQNFPHSLGF
jgi:hypothetical protein